MFRAASHPVNRAVDALVRTSLRFRYGVLLLAAATTVAAGWYTATHIGISTNTAEMLSEKLPWRIAYIDYQEAFPLFEDTIVVVVDGETPDIADEAAARLATVLATDKQHFTDVFHPLGSAFMRRHQLLYADLDALDELASQLAGAQALLGRLAAAPGLVALLDLLTDVVQHGADASADAERFKHATAAAINGVLNGNETPMSWRNLLLGAASTETGQVVFTLKPVLDFSSILPGEEAINALRAAAADLGYSNNPAVSIRLTGAAALADDELASVIRGAEQAGVLAFVLVALCLVVGLRSLSLVVATLVTLVVGLVFTACFAAAAIGTLNMISVAFAVLYVGLGVDFAIHFGLRYRELSATNTRVDAIRAAAGHIGSSIALCAFTTAIAFFMFIPTAYRGVAELGLISGVGMLVGLVVSLSVLPALLAVLPAPRSAEPRPATGGVATRGRRWTGPVTLLALVCGGAAALTLPFARFDLNPLHLNDPQAESVRTVAELAAAGNDPLHTISVLVANAADRAGLTRELEALAVVDEVRSVSDLIPTEQDNKLAVLEDLSLSLGADLTPGPALALDPAAARTALSTLLTALNSARASAGNAALHDAARQLDERLAAAPERAPALLERVEHKLMHHFRPQLERLNDALGAGPVSVSELPAGLRARWIADDGRQRLEIRPAYNLHDNQRLVEFVDGVRAVAGDGITDTPVINLAASRAVTAAFFQAFASAAVLIALVLWLLLRSVREVGVLLAPLALAALLTTAVSVAAGLPFNFANIIALPLLLGIGVDSALHILHRYKTMGTDSRALHQTSTARAVLFSALTTTASFGNLALSPHAGTASMGLMLTIGLAITLLTTLVVLPALLHRYVSPGAGA